jgi:hypothetical protein
MSSLGISILILAVSAIVAVVAVNLAQALGRRRRLAAARPRGEGDKARERGGEAPAEALAASEDRATAPRGSRADRREPRLGDVAAPGGAEPGFSPSESADPDAPPDRAEIAGQPGPARSATAAAPVRPPAPAPVLSPMCDCIVTLPLETPMPGERLIAATQGIRRAGGKPILVDGLPVGFESEDDAVPLAAGIAFRGLRMGVLLANRHGPLNAMEYSEFVAAAQAVADQLATLADTPDMADVIARARDLDATCAQLDAQIGLNVDSPEALGPAQVAALAAELGMVDRGGHRHARLGPAGELVFTMSLTDSPQRLGFLLDVPRTAESHEGWSAMLDCARDVAARLSGRVVDDAGRPIPLESLDTIARQLAQRYASLDAIGLPAGSPLALRVFN